ncbi:MAG TPA: YesL family protein [Candidatus Choladousia intestinipullorum]|nr:YesL family protein [Candidatus Choladousia intestinipullorum]
MQRFFSMDNGLFRALNRISDLMILNLIFILCCIPVVTIGPALTGLYYVTLKIASNEEGYIVRGFFKSFKQNFRQGLIIWLILLAAGCVFGVDIFILIQTKTAFSNVLLVIISATALVFLMVFLYIFPVLSRFENNIRATFKNSLIIAVADFPRTFVMMVITAAAVILTFWNSITLWYGLLVWILVGFSGLAFINSHFLNKIFAKYMPEEDAAGDEADENTADEDSAKRL